MGLAEWLAKFGEGSWQILNNSCDQGWRWGVGERQNMRVGDGVFVAEWSEERAGEHM